MKKKQQKIQIILILIGLILIIATYFKPLSNKVELTEDEPGQKNFEDTTDDKRSTSFENVEYNGLYDLNKPFTVKSEKAHILDEDPDVVYMTRMHVIMHLSDGRIVDIISDKGKYNKLTYDCFFEDNVNATDGETKIFAQNLDLLATKNSVEIYNNVFLNYPTGSLRADKIDYDFETKFFKVSMFNDKDIKMKVIK